MTDYSKITALYSRLSVGDEDRDGGESNSIQNQKIFLENYARGQHLTNIRHYIDDDESGRFFDRSAYSRMMDDVENGKIGVCIMKDLTRWGRDYLQVGNAMEIFRRNNVRFIAVNNGIDSEKPDTLEFAPFINIMSEWYAKDISKKVKTGIKTKGMSGKPIVTEAPYGYVKDPDNKDFWIIDEEAAEVVRLIFRLFIGGKNRNQIAVHLTQEQIPTPTFYMKDRGRGTCKNKTLNEDNRCKWNKVTLTNILTRQEYCGDVVNFKTTKHFRDKHNHYVDRSQWHITENVHEPVISRSDFETVQRILKNAPVRRPNGDGEIHPLSGLLFCKDCGAKMHIRIDYRNGGKRHVAFCSEYHKGKAKNPKCHSPHIMDADLLMQTIAEVLKKIEDYIPFGKLTIIQGNPGEGKTYFAMMLTAACTNRKLFPNMEDIEPFNVIYQTAEDGMGDTIKPRLVEAGADLSRVMVIDDTEEALTLSDDRIEKAVRQNQVRLVIIDPVQAFIGADVDMNRANEVRPVFRKLGMIAEKTGCAIVLIGHLNKSSGTQSTYRGLGSIDIIAAVRSLIFIGKVRKDPTTRVLIHEKSSLAPPGETMAFKLGDEEGFRWVGAYEISADELLDGKEGKATETKLERGRKLIRELLADKKEISIRELDEKAKEQGISGRTMRDVRSRMKNELEYRVNEKQENSIRLKE